MDTPFRFATQLKAARSVPDLRTCCVEFSAAMGFGHFIYALRIPVSLTEPYHFCISGYPRAWREQYDRLGYLRIDPIVRHVFSSSLPLIWDDIDRSEPAVRNFFAEATVHGLAHGVSTPVAGRSGDLGLFSLSRDTPIAADESHREEIKQRLLWFATHLHESVRKLVLTQEGVPVVAAALSDREKDCLMWAADGKTSAEIAKMMSITERTVLFHFESAGRKLGANGRHNILSRAIALGEIDLNTLALQTAKRLPVMHESRS